MKSIIIRNNQKLFSTEELKDEGFSQYIIQKMVNEGKLIRLNKSYYENPDFDGEDSDFYYVKAYAPKGVICLLSAAVYYNLSTFIPDAIDVAIPRKSKVSMLPEYPKLNVHYYTDERYNFGIVDIKEDGNSFLIYDIEKTVVDTVFYREKVGIEETKEILITYLRNKKRNLNQLIHYSKQMKCENVMRQYLEVLV